MKVRMLSIFVVQLFAVYSFGLISESAIAAISCPVPNPLEVEKDSDIDVKAKRKFLLCNCGTQQPDGDYVLRGEYAQHYLVLINDNFLARYDLNCSLEFEGDERTKYITDQASGLDKKIADARSNAKKRARFRIKRWTEQVDEKNVPIQKSVALGVLLNPPAKENQIDLGYTVSVDSAQDVENVKFGFKFRETPWISPTTRTQLSAAYALDLAWKEVDTAQANTVTKAADFLPVSFSFVSTDNLTFSLSAGLAYLETSKLELATGLKQESDNLAFVYKLGLSYQTKIQCLSFGTEYKIRTKSFASDRLSYEWYPKVTVNLLKPCKSD